MKKPKPNLRDAGGLHSLERWRTAQLDHAQAAHVQRQKLVAERTDVVTAVQGLIEQSQAVAREHLAENRILSADSLTRIRHYTSTQVEKLDEANAALNESRQAAAQAHEAMCRKFEELAAVERLRLRRKKESMMESARHEQKRLDDQAMLRSAAQISDDAKSRRKKN